MHSDFRSLWWNLRAGALSAGMVASVLTVTAGLLPPINHAGGGDKLTATDVFEFVAVAVLAFCLMILLYLRCGVRIFDHTIQIRNPFRLYTIDRNEIIDVRTKHFYAGQDCVTLLISTSGDEFKTIKIIGLPAARLDFITSKRKDADSGGGDVPQ